MSLEECNSELGILRERLDDHLERYNMDREERIRFEEQILVATQRNSEGIEKLTKSTQGLIDSWIMITGIRKLLVWLASIGGLGWLTTWVHQKFPSLLD